MRRVTLVLGLVALAVVAVSAAGPVVQHHGWFGSMLHRFNSWMPWSDNLGHDHVDTLDKVETIYTKTHENAQRRVDELKEDSLKSNEELQKAIADIYQEEALRAEKEIDALKHPMLQSLIHRRKTTVEAQPSTSTFTSTFTNKLRDTADDISDKAGDLKDSAGKYADRAKVKVDDLSKKIVSGYRSALDQAKATASSASSGTSATWHDTKRKVSEVYNHAFHKGHGEAHTAFSKFRDSLGLGLHRTFGFAKSAMHHTFDFFTHALMAVIYMMIGVALGLWALSFWRQRKFHQQLNTPVLGPITAMGEYMVVGNEDFQRKFYEYWSGPAAQYFARQTGLRKHWMQRGVGQGSNNMWLTYSEWASIEDLRRAVRSPEFTELRNKAPKAATHHMTLYQVGTISEGIEATKETDTRGLRNRGAAATTVQ